LCVCVCMCVLCVCVCVLCECVHIYTGAPRSVPLNKAHASGSTKEETAHTSTKRDLIHLQKRPTGFAVSCERTGLGDLSKNLADKSTATAAEESVCEGEDVIAIATLKVQAQLLATRFVQENHFSGHLTKNLNPKQGWNKRPRPTD